MRRLLPLLAALCLLPAAHAQIISVYGTYAGTRVSGLSTPLSQSGSSIFTSGVGGGLTLGVLPVGPVHLGLDIRGATRPGTNGSDLILVGPRIALKLPIIRVKPYLQASGGYLRTRYYGKVGSFPVQTITGSYAAYEVIGGIDYPLLPILDLRLIEIGGGQAYNLNSDNTANSLSLLTINSGLVLHF